MNQWQQEYQRIKYAVEKSEDHGLAGFSAEQRAEIMKCIDQRMAENAKFTNNNKEVEICLVEFLK